MKSFFLLIVFLICTRVCAQNLQEYLNKHKLSVKEPLVLFALSTRDCDRCTNIGKYHLERVKARGITNDRIVLVVNSSSKEETNLLLYKQIKFDKGDLENISLVEDKGFFKFLSPKSRSSLIVIDNHQISFNKPLSEITHIEDEIPYFISNRKEYIIPNQGKIPNLYYKFYAIKDSMFVVFNAQYQILKNIKINKDSSVIEDIFLPDSIYRHFLYHHLNLTVDKETVLKDAEKLNQYGIAKIKINNYGFYQQKHYFICAFAYLLTFQNTQKIQTYQCLIEKTEKGDISKVLEIQPLPSGYYPSIREDFYIKDDTIYMATVKKFVTSDSSKKMKQKFYSSALIKMSNKQLDFLKFAEPELPKHQIAKRYYYDHIMRYFVEIDHTIWILTNFYPYFEQLTTSNRIALKSYKGAKPPKISDKSDIIQADFSLNAVSQSYRNDLVLIFMYNKKRFLGVFNREGKEITKKELPLILNGCFLSNQEAYLMTLPNNAVKIEKIKF
jgi:hypothetical protein